MAGGRRTASRVRLALVACLLVVPVAVAAARSTTDDDAAPGPVRAELEAGAGEDEPSSVGPATPPPGPPQVKEPISGLVDRKGRPDAAWQDVVGGHVVNVTWAQLQPQPGGPIAADNPIDRALRINATSGRELQLKIRVLSGVHAPEWVKQLGGPPVTVGEPQGGTTGTVGRFWTEEHGAAYAALQVLLAERYDHEPAVREVTMSRCTTFYAEPMIRHLASTASVAALRDAGLTLEADEACLREMVAAHEVWTTTPSGLALNPHQDVVVERVALDVTARTMDACLATLADRCVLQNNSIREDLDQLGPNYRELYCDMAARDAPTTFQTAAPARVGDLDAVLDLAVALGARAVELPKSYPSATTRERLAAVAEQLATMPDATPPPGWCTS